MSEIITIADAARRIGRNGPFALVHTAAFALALSALGACSSVDPQPVVVSEPNILPANYRPEILAFLRSYLNDPTAIRSASISEPALRPAGIEQRYTVCLRFNAKNNAGAYEGSKERIVFFLAGKLDTMIDARKEQCAGAVYQPFPELERLAR